MLTKNYSLYLNDCELMLRVCKEFFLPIILFLFPISTVAVIQTRKEIFE